MFLIQREKVKLLTGENFPEPKKEGVREREARGRESEREREGGWVEGENLFCAVELKVFHP